MSPSRERAPARSMWRVGVPVVCLLAGLLLAAAHDVSGGAEIRRSDAPRLVDLVREAQDAVARLNAERDVLAEQVANTHGTTPGPALAAMRARTAVLAADGLDPVHGPGVVVTLNDAQRDADGQFPSDAGPDDLVVHQSDIQAVLNALWAGGAEAIAVQDQRIVATSAPRCVGNTLLLNGRTYSPPYVISAIGEPAAMQAALAEAPLVGLFKQYVMAFGLGYTEQVSDDVQVVGNGGALRLTHARPTDPVGY